jgi:hypothetical protein
MKTILISAFTIIMAVSAFATSPEYHDAMLLNIKNIDTTKTGDDFIALAGTFERIASVEKDEWLPLYYASYCYIQASFNVKDEDKKDVMADKAIELIDNVSKIRPTESELFTLSGFADMAKLSAKPMQRGMTYMSKIRESMNKAMELNPKNPRPMYLLGLLTYNTPEMWGGGKDKAMPQLKEAQEKFNNFVPENDLSPAWGKSGCEYFINK